VRGVAKEADLTPKQLHRMLSAEGNPEFRNLAGILRVMGLRLSVRPIAEPATA
jgi:DNA-binding phage protein